MIVIAAGVCALPGRSAAAQFEYAGFVSADDRVYIETAPLGRFMGDVKKFYSALRGQQSANELLMLGNAMRAKMGINPMDPAHLNAAGVSADRPLALAFENINAFSRKKPAVPASGKQAIVSPDQWTMFMPARDSAALYKNLKLLFEKVKKPAAQGGIPQQQQQAGPAVKEITRGRLFQMSDGSLFVGRGGSFVVMASSKKRALSSLKEAARPLSKSGEFIAFTQHVSSKYGNGNATMLSYVNNKGMGAAYLNQFLSAGQGKAAVQNPIIAESRENLLGESGVWMMDDRGMRIHNDSLYAPGFLADVTKMLPVLINNPRVSMNGDHYGNIPAAYGSISLSVNGLMKVIETIQPENMQKFNMMNQQFKAGTGKDLRKDLFENATGSVSMLLAKLPDFNNSQAVDKWDMSIHVGYRPEKRGDIAGIFGIIADAERKRGGDTKYAKETIGGQEVWSITTTKQVKQPARGAASTQFQGTTNMDQQQQQQNQQTVATVTTTTYLHFAPDEAVISFNRLFLESILQKKFERAREPLATRLMGVSAADLDRTTLLMYVRVDAVIDFLKTSPFILFAGPVMPYIQNMSDISITAKHEGDVLYSTFNLKLKEGAGFH
jgi:hypothetical protein